MIKKSIQFSLVLILGLIIPAILPPGIYATQFSTSIQVEGEKTIIIGTFELPFPLDDHKITIYASPSISGSSSLVSSTNRDIISPGEKVDLSLQILISQYSSHIDVRILDTSKSTGKTYFDSTVGSDLPLMDIPGSYTSPTIAIPVVPIPIPYLNLVVQLSLSATIHLETSVSISVQGSRVSPESQTVRFVQAGMKSVSYSKVSGVGADLIVKETQVEATGSISIGAMITIAKVIQTPLRFDFISIPLTDWITTNTQSITLATLKTPIQIDASAHPESVTFGEQTIIRGKINPEASGIHIQLISDGSLIGTALTSNDGSFEIPWKPGYSGTLNWIVTAPGTKYSLEASSVTKQINVVSQSSHSAGYQSSQLIYIGLGIILVLISIGYYFWKKGSNQM